MKILKGIGILILLLIIGYFLGPQVEEPRLSPNPLPIKAIDLHELEYSINESEAAIADLKPDNQARIVWYDSTYQKTPYSLVYLHGFSASQEEGDPIHELVSKRYGMNLYLPRLYGHGIDNEDAMLNLTPEKLLESAKEAIAVAQQIGEKVIVLSTSTGGTLSLFLAQSNPAIAGQIMYAPNIDLFDEMSNILTKPWGLQIARLVKGSNYHVWEIDSLKAAYWTGTYRLEAVVQLRAMLNATMTDETFVKVKQPTFAGYYFKSDHAKDSTISIEAINNMMKVLGTDESLKRTVAFPDAGTHVIGSWLTSKDVESVKKETFSFIEEVLKIEPKAAITLPLVEEEAMLH